MSLVNIRNDPLSWKWPRHGLVWFCPFTPEGLRTSEAEGHWPRLIGEARALGASSCFSPGTCGPPLPSLFPPPPPLVAPALPSPRRLPADWVTGEPCPSQMVRPWVWGKPLSLPLGSPPLPSPPPAPGPSVSLHSLPHPPLEISLPSGWKQSR